jgi:L-threonylcarbamoyladenylate synthase
MPDFCSMAETVLFDAGAPEKAFSLCRAVLLSGGVIAYPTETFYGLGADPRNPAAVKRLFEVKGRRPDQPILLLLPDVRSVADWAAEISPTAKKLMSVFWPGPLTLVFKARDSVARELTAGTGTIGLRLSGSALVADLLRFLDMTITGTSANLSGGRSPETAEMVAETIGSGIDLILDGGKTPGGRPSTVFDVSVDPPLLVRDGLVAVREIGKQVKIRI